MIDTLPPYDIATRCHVCLDPAPKGWALCWLYCVKCHTWNNMSDHVDDPDFNQRLHPALERLDWERQRPSGKHDLHYMVRRLERRIEALERKVRI